MINGGMKFFETSKCLGVNGATASATNGNSAAIYALDLNPYTYWYTVDSNDSLTEVLTVDFGAPQDISRLLLILHNFKQFRVKYDLMGAWTDFSNVLGLNGALSTISETSFADNCSYYEFDQVTTQKIKISIDKTQIANDDKFLSQVIVTSEIGTFAGFPTVKNSTLDRNSRIKKTLTGKMSVQKADETATLDLSFKSYPSAITYNVDMDLLMTLHDRDFPFLIWPCGGRRGNTYFGYTLRSFRLQDIYQVQLINPLALSYTQSVYKNSLNAEAKFQEAISV